MQSIKHSNEEDQLWIWSHNRLIKNSRFNVETDEEYVTLDGHVFCLTNTYLGDADMLLDERADFVGVSFILGEVSKEFGEVVDRLCRSSNLIFVDDGILCVLLKETKDFTIESLQAVGTRLYFSRNSDEILVALPIRVPPDIKPIGNQ
jgi:hypothetical protein